MSIRIDYEPEPEGAHYSSIRFQDGCWFLCTDWISHTHKSQIPPSYAAELLSAEKHTAKIKGVKLCS